MNELELEHLAQSLPVNPGVTVLIVDDSDDHRELLRRYFELAGCRVILAHSAESAIQAYSDVVLDLAVIDLLLPGMSGWDFTARLQQDHPDCPVAITSVLDAEDYPPADATLAKPVTRANVTRVLNHCVPDWSAP